MKNSTLLMVMGLLMALVIGVTGTMAYLTDTDSDVNVMVMGNVDIEQHENDREGNEFEQNQTLLPIVGSASDKDDNGYPAPDNYIDKIVTVENTGKNDAYVRTLIAIPVYTYEGFEGNNASLNVLHWNGYSIGDTKYPAVTVPSTGEQVENHWYWGKENTSEWPGNAEGWNTFSATIDGQDYTVFVVTHTEKVAPGEFTAPNMIGVYLDEKVDYDHETGKYTMDGKAIAGFDGTVEVLVATQAVQYDSSWTAWEALEAAFGTPSADNHPWEDGVTMPAANWADETDTSWYYEDASADEFVLNDAADLAGFAKLVNDGNTFEGKTVKLGANIDLGAHEWTPIADNSKTDGTFSGTFDGQNYTVKNVKIARGNDDNSWCVGFFGYTENATVKNLKLHNVDIANGYAYTGAVVGYAEKGTITNVHVTGDIKIEDAAYVGGIIGYGNAEIDSCSVSGNAGSYIRTPGQNAQTSVGGIVGNRASSSTSNINNCTVKDVSISGYAMVGAISGHLYANNNVNGCTVENVTLTLKRTDGNPSVGLLCGTNSNLGSSPVAAELHNNTFTNVTLNGTAKAPIVHNALHGFPYDGVTEFNTVESNNVINGFTNNLIVH